MEFLLHVYPPLKFTCMQSWGHDIGKNALSTFWPSTNQVVFMLIESLTELFNLSSTVTIEHVLMIIA